MIEKERRILSHLEKGRVMRGDEWVSLDEAGGLAESSRDAEHGADTEFSPHGDTRAIEPGTSRPSEDREREVSDAETSPASTFAEEDGGGSETASMDVFEVAAYGSSQHGETATSAGPDGTTRPPVSNPEMRSASVRPVSSGDNPALGDWETAQSRRRRNLLIVSAGAGLAAAAAVAATVALCF